MKYQYQQIDSIKMRLCDNNCRFLVSGFPRTGVPHGVFQHPQGRNLSAQNETPIQLADQINHRHQNDARSIIDPPLDEKLARPRLRHTASQLRKTAISMKALVLNGTQARVVDNRPIPKLRDDYILVKTVAVALNPTDSKAISQGRAAPNGLAGCDFAGTVEEVGSKVTKPWKKGDRVFGSAHGANGNNPEDGTFAEIITVKGDVVMRIPDNMSFEDASTIAVTGITCGQGLFQQMKLNWPTKESGMDKEYILIYGGSSSCGTLAIQYAKL